MSSYMPIASEVRSPVSIAARKPVWPKSIAVAIGCVQAATTPVAHVNFRLTRDEAVLLDQVACKLGETIAITVTVKGSSQA